MNNDIKKFDILVYHDNCMDGLVSVAIAAEYCDEDCLLIPGDYREDIDFEIFIDKHVCFLDYSTKRDIMVMVLDAAAGVTVLDHHISAWHELHDITDDRFNFVYDVRRSGAQIAWDYFTDLPQPPFIKLIGDRDLWTKKYESSDVMNLALRVVDPGVKGMRVHIRHLIDNHERHHTTDFITRNLINKGESFQKYHDYLVKGICEQAKYANLSDGKDTEVWKVNCPLGLMSDVGAVLAKTSPSGVAWLYYCITDTEVKHSLRVSANSEYNASEFAASKNGGGHIKAAGWSSDSING